MNPEELKKQKEEIERLALAYGWDKLSLQELAVIMDAVSKYTLLRLARQISEAVAKRVEEVEKKTGELVSENVRS